MVHISYMEKHKRKKNAYKITTLTIPKLIIGL